jgi:hypothetical protein
MRQALSVIFGVLLAVTLAAQDHDNKMDKKVVADVSIGDALRAGDITILPGDYLVVCDRTKVVFTRKLDGKRYELPCKGTIMEKKAGATKMMTNVDKNGVRYIDKLLLAGSNVEHTFN